MPIAFRPPLRRVLAALAAFAAFALPQAARAQVFTPDDLFYRVYQGDRLLGRERVTFEQKSDSGVVISTTRQLLPRPGGAVDTLLKTSTTIIAIADGTLRGYQSTEIVNGDVMSRMLSMSDTTYTSYRQSRVSGFGDTFARPPGRIYVVDPQVFALFDLLCRDFHRQSYDERPVTMLYVTARDTAVEARVKRLGKVPFKVGDRQITAEKLSIKDPWSEFTAWVSPTGQMLRLWLPAVGLRVDRDPETLTPGRVMPMIEPPPVGMPTVMMGPSPKRLVTKSVADSLERAGRELVRKRGR